MPRRRSQTDADQIWDAILKVLMVVPIWVGPILAIAAYLVVRLIFPLMLEPLGRELGSPLATVCRNIAPLVALVFIAIWILAEFQKRSRSKLLDSCHDIESIRNLSWQEFERLVGEAFRRKGYLVQEVGGGGADGGVDLRLERQNELVPVQCKQWKSWRVGVKIVRELYGVMAAERATSGIVVTCGRFTREAQQFAEGKPLTLIDGPALWDLVKDVQAPTRTAKQSTECGASHGLEPIRVGDPSLPCCPKCGSPMVLKTAKRGANRGSQFYGCSTFPACRGIVNLESK